MDRISHAFSRAQRSQSRLALLYLDLDHFKDVNDAYGHQAGDRLLIETAGRLLRQVRDVDTVCRLGGDEFTIILESITQSSDASLVAKKIVDSLKPSFFINGQEIYAPASLGIALYPYDGKTVDELVKNADAAMYEAKEAGRGQFRFASGAAGKSSKHRLEMEALLRRRETLGRCGEAHPGGGERFPKAI
jgi:diguanylate cyclase (GGDEF)-like protein